jgi:hypothetical protein
MFVFSSVYAGVHVHKHRTFLADTNLLKYLLMPLDEFNTILLLSDCLIRQKLKV